MPVPVRVESTVDGAVYLKKPGIAFSDLSVPSKVCPADFRSSWTPGWHGTSPAGSIGNGTISGFYSRSGKTVTFSIELVLGSTSVAPGYGMGFSLPLPAASGKTFTCSVISFDSSTSTYYADTGVVSAQSISLPRGNGYFGAASALPMAWSSGDTLRISGSYFVD